MTYTFINPHNVVWTPYCAECLSDKELKTYWTKFYQEGFLACSKCEELATWEEEN